jgi:mitogen-activated protein kinase organizer 1
LLTSTLVSVTSVSPTRRNDAYLVSTLDSTLRLMDKSSGKLLQSYRSPNVRYCPQRGLGALLKRVQFSNTNYRLRSTLGSHDSVVLSGSEDGRIIAWDLLEGNVLHELWHDESMEGAKGSKRSVVGVVTECPVRDEWCSAGGDGMFFRTCS